MELVATFEPGMWRTRKTQFLIVYNKYDKARTSRHQPGGIGTTVRDAMTWYTQPKSRDERDLGKYYFYVIWLKPNHKYKVVVTYKVCNGKTKGPRTQFQQIIGTFRTKILRLHSRSSSVDVSSNNVGGGRRRKRG